MQYICFFSLILFVVFALIWPTGNFEYRKKWIDNLYLILYLFFGVLFLISFYLLKITKI